jgi:hypothetical protein
VNLSIKKVINPGFYSNINISDMEPFLINFFYSNLALDAEAVPKKILDLMNVEKLTRENVASHLQAQILTFLFSVQYDI